MNAPFSGGCHCGAVRYECTAPPLRMVNCHCRDCQRAGGAGAAPTVIVPASAVRLLAGHPAVYAVTADSGAVARRAFCAACGSPLFASSSARDGLLGLRAGSLDDASGFRPAAELWTASAQPWDRLDPALPHFPRGR